MKYLVQMKLADSSRPASPQEGITFMEQFILPTLELCQKLEAELKILAGGATSGSVALSLIVSAESVQELDDMIMALPVWPRMETTVTALTSFEGRMAAVRARLDHLKAQTQNDAGMPA
ncbi:MAG TPA: muconolactone Delta-isomerase family protein [Terriglobales bacterium]|nr:muconolactone Delta-isomerase family protein [Terriglobales bacterium]